MEQKPSVMVCVTTQRACERLIKAGAKAAAPSESPLNVVHVTGSRQHFFNAADEASALEYLFTVSKQHNANMTVLRSDDVAQTIADYARQSDARLVVFGQSGEQIRSGGVVERVQELLEDTGIATAIYTPADSQS